MRVICITTVPLSLRFFRGQSNFFRKYGLFLEFISSPGDLLTRFGEEEMVRTYGINIPRKISPFGDLRAVARIHRVLRNRRPDIVHSHTPKAGLIGMICATLSMTPVRIYHIHGLPYMTAKGWKRHLLLWTERISCFLANEVICVSASVRQTAIADGICIAEKISVLAEGSINGVDALGQFNPERFPLAYRKDMRYKYGIREDSLIIGFIGRIVRDKGVDELAQAWSSIREEFPMAYLLLVGPIEQHDPINPSSLHTFENDDRVHVIGMVDDPAPWYSIFDILVLPSHREGFGLVLIEAASMELPVIATRIPGCVDAVQDGVTGILIPVRDSGALAEALRPYLEEPKLRRLHGEAGRVRVLQLFRQEAIWEEMIKKYHQLLYKSKSDSWNKNI